jgi:hypothetical protein
MTNQSSIRSTHPYTTLAAAIVIAAVVIAAGIFASLYLGTATTVTQTSTVYRTTTSTLTSYITGTCLKEVPQSAVINYAQNSTFEGYSVTYSNGTEDFFSLNSCPVPVTPDKYQVDSMIATNPKFVAAENGSTYMANPFDGLGPSMNNSTGQYAVLVFGLYGSQRIYPCGGSVWDYKELGAIQAIIPINSTGGLQLSNTEIKTIPTNSLNQFPCATTTT